MRREENLKSRMLEYISVRYGIEPEYPWARFPDYAVMRNPENRKWFALIMNVPYRKLGLEGNGTIDIMNVKAPDFLTWDMLIHQEGIIPGYHISRGCWVSVLLNGSIPQEDLEKLIDMSFSTVSPGRKAGKPREPKEWLIPSNPKYFDIVHAFDNTDTIEWKEGNGIRKGDTVFIYVAQPVAAIMFRCSVIETGIPADYRNGKLTIKRKMRIRCDKHYDPEAFPMSKLREEYGIYSVRSPRSVPYSLSCMLSPEKQ